MSATIKETSRDFDAVERYLMTVSPGITSLKDVEDGTVISVDGYLTFEDEKSDGETVNILSIITPEKAVYSCQSATFKRSLMEIATLMEGKTYAVIKISGKTKGGRDFINCVLDVESVS